MRNGVHRLRPVIASAVLLLYATAAAAAFPSHPVRLIVQGAAGSGPDVIARIVADALGQRWNQPVIVVNQPGAGGLVAGRVAASAEPDGHTVYMPSITTFVILPEMHDALPFDLEGDFVPLGLVAETPMMIAVAPSLGVGTLGELIALAQKRPGELFYAANNRGSLPHLAGELFRRRAGVDIAFVPYPGVTAGLQDVAGGRVQIIVESVGALSAAAQGGRIRPLAVASPSRLPQLPDVPTVAETLPGVIALGWFAWMAPRGVPADRVRKINADLNTVLQDAGVVQRLRALGAVARPMTPDATAEFLRAEQQAWRPLVRDLGLKTQ